MLHHLEGLSIFYIKILFFNFIAKFNIKNRIIDYANKEIHVLSSFINSKAIIFSYRE